MSLAVLPIRCLQDNYAYLLPAADGTATLIDAPEPSPIKEALAQNNLTLTHILLTHHHWDHVDGVEALRDGVTVVGARADAHRLPALDIALAPGDRIDTGRRFEVLDAPGHTLGHIAFYEPGGAHLFSGDSLMTQGCGRLFEGTPAQMFDTVLRLGSLPAETRLWSGHDYSATNMRFAAQFGAETEALKQREIALDVAAGQLDCTSGLTLALERQLNPFMRTDLDETAATLNLVGAPPSEVFAQLRRERDHF